MYTHRVDSAGAGGRPDVTRSVLGSSAHISSIYQYRNIF